MTTQVNIKKEVQERYGAIAEQHLRPTAVSPIELLVARSSPGGKQLLWPGGWLL